MNSKSPMYFLFGKPLRLAHSLILFFSPDIKRKTLTVSGWDLGNLPQVRALFYV